MYYIRPLKWSDFAPGHHGYPRRTLADKSRAHAMQSQQIHLLWRLDRHKCMVALAEVNTNPGERVSWCAEANSPHDHGQEGHRTSFVKDNLNKQVGLQPRQRVARFTAYAGFLVIVFLSLVPGTLRLHTGLGGSFEHFIAYAFVGGALGFGYRVPQLLAAGILLSVTAAMLEAAQHFVPGRTPEFVGFAPGLLGTWVGLALAVTIERLGRS